MSIFGIPAVVQSMKTHPLPLITNDAVVLGLLMAILGFVFWSFHSGWPGFQKFYKVAPMLLMCYFLPSLLTLCGLVDPEVSQLYFVASRYLLPACLVLLTLSIDLREILKLGPKALIMFLTGTVGVVLGGPLAVGSKANIGGAASAPVVAGAFHPSLAPVGVLPTNAKKENGIITPATKRTVCSRCCNNPCEICSVGTS